MFVLVLIGVPFLELFVFIEVGRAIGWLPAVVLLLGTSPLGVRLLRIQGRSAIDRVSLAVSEHRAPARAAVDGALGFLGALLLVIQWCIGVSWLAWCLGIGRTLGPVRLPCL
jgi:UPF0716 protein FxsA